MKLPLVVILGATGSGKTKLSLDLAKRFGGEIIGADSMQIYKELDIISAKPTIEERKQATHHLVDFLQPHETCTVVDYRNKALTVIDNLFKKNVLPIVVGGTNYYIESLLWKILIEEPGKRPSSPPRNDTYNNLTNDELYKKLKMLDPDMANRLHPNNKRKVIRALEVHDQQGRKISDIFKEQRNSTGGNVFGGGSRFSKVVIFWLKWDQKILHERINSRVDNMLEEGLLTELLNFHKKYNESRMTESTEPDYTRGIYQMIGFKEFHNYLLLSEDERNGEAGKKIFQQASEDLKMVTRRYAKKQVKWINNRLLAETGREVPYVYGLTTDDLSKWDDEITKPAVDIIECSIRDEVPKYQPIPKIEAKGTANADDETFFCETCQRVFIGNFQWKKHLHSHKHKRVKDSIARKMAKVQKLDQTENINEKLAE